MGAFGFATVPGLQMRIMNYAAQAPTLASGANIAAFNVGNALGAWLGGITIAAGLGFTSPIWMGAAITLAPCSSWWWPPVADLDSPGDRRRAEAVAATSTPTGTRAFAGSVA